MCWTSASGERKLLFQAMQSAAAAAENVCAFGFARVQIKECFTDETLQRISAYLGQSILHHVSIWLWIFNPYPHSNHSLSQPVENRFFVLRRLTAVPHYCAEYFWLSAAKVWTQPFIILSQGKQLASFSKQTPRDADWSMLSCGPLTESQYF